MTRRIKTAHLNSTSLELTAEAEPAKPPPIDDRQTQLGAIFTKRWVAELVLDLAGYTADQPLHAGTILEPACGHGAFIDVIVERLVESCLRNDVDLGALSGALVGIDLDPDAVAVTKRTAVRRLTESGMARESAADLADQWIRHGDFLRMARSLPAANWVVGNPPYVRIEDVSKGDMTAYRSAWPTMSGRADVYVGFFEAGLSVLQRSGRLSYICADRWMRNRYGAALRALVENDYAVDTCVVMHTVDAFEDRVSAYPAITVLAASPQGNALAVEASDTFDAAAASRLVKIRNRGPAPMVVDDDFRASWLTTWPRDRDSWPAGAPEQLHLLATLEAKFPTLAATGADISVGTATGADDIYVIDDPNLVEDGMAFPTLAARETALGGIDWRERYLVTPWTRNGLIDLDDYPKMKRYLTGNKARLTQRHVAQRNPDRWWRTIDRIDPALACKPKLLIPDLKDRIHPVYDQGKFIPLHSLYYVTSDTWDLAVLGGLLMSRVANMFVEAYSVRMANGYMRVSAQYLRRVRVPRPADIPKAIADELRAAFWSRDEQQATAAALMAYGLETWER